jgi:dynein heavy chain
MQMRKYTLGLETLKETNTEVEKLQKQIIEYQPILENLFQENKALIAQLNDQNDQA